MTRDRLTNHHQQLLKNNGYQVVFHGDSTLSRKIYECDTFETATDLVNRKKADSQKRRPRRNLYIIWLRKGVWSAVVLETGTLKKY
jgi:hypothetical protein